MAIRSVAAHGPRRDQTRGINLRRVGALEERVVALSQIPRAPDDLPAAFSRCRRRRRLVGLAGAADRPEHRTQNPTRFRLHDHNTVEADPE